MKKIIMIGLVGTGKTTFLAAFWHIVESEKYHLKMAKLPSPADYIYSISKKWVNCEPIERTIPGRAQKVEFTLEYIDKNEVFNLILPDLSGELFEEHFKERQWDDDYEKLIADSPGILLFIHPDKIVEPFLINDANKVVKVLDNEGSSGSKEKVEIIEWGAEHSPTEVKLVDLLQLHMSHEFKSKLKIAVIISAWDRIITTNCDNPNEWLKLRLPLLNQFLIANDDIIQFKTFGISAQGGDINSKKEDLLKKLNPTERIIVKNNEATTSHDLSSPVVWVLSE